MIGSLAAPPDSDDEAIRDEIEGFVSGLLGLVGITADPLASREHILISNLVERAWAAGEDLTLEALLARVHRPPLRKLGVFEIDTFFPEKDRLNLAMRFNALLASPSFAAWRSGPPLDIESMLWSGDTPRAAIVYLAHLSDDERQFVVTAVLSKLVTWMRSQKGSSDLRAMVYMDEVFGFVPPTAAPPSKKPILTILKQARAFGTGMLLSTQNPIDLDYKAMSNAGTWCVGRLQTERDKMRILEALQSASGDRDVSRLDALISALDKREFLLHDTRESEPTVFATRWAMSYLRGPLTKNQITDLTADDPLHDMGVDRPADAERAVAGVADDESAIAPEIAPGVPVHYLDPAAASADQVGADRNGARFEAALCAQLHLTFDDERAGVDHDEVWEAVYHPLGARIDAADATVVDYDERDFLDEAPAGTTYLLPEAPIDKEAFFAESANTIKDHLHRSRSIQVLCNRDLKLYSRVGESAQEFSARCDAAAQEHADREVAKIRDRFEGKMDTIRSQIEAARLKVDDAGLDADTRRNEELVSGAGTLIGVLFGGRRSSRSMSSTASKRSMTRRAEQRLRTAEAKLTTKVEDLTELEDSLAEEITEINAEWSAVGNQIKTMEIGLEKTDIAADEVALVWIPHK